MKQPSKPFLAIRVWAPGAALSQTPETLHPGVERAHANQERCSLDWNIPWAFAMKEGRQSLKKMCKTKPEALPSGSTQMQTPSAPVPTLLHPLPARPPRQEQGWGRVSRKPAHTCDSRVS